jgi:hypothetical protein
VQDKNPARPNHADFMACDYNIEELHKALKSGVGAERLQRDTAEGLCAAVALMSVVALRLLDLREHVRRTPERPAEDAW